MISYIFKRLILMLPTLIGIMTLNFFIIQFAPGGPLEQAEAEMMGLGGDEGDAIEGGALSELDKRRLKRLFGMDKPLWERYLRMLLWWGPHEIGYLEDLPEGDSQSFISRGETYLLLNSNNDVIAFKGSCSDPHQPSEIWFKDDSLVCTHHHHRYDLQGNYLGEENLASLQPISVTVSEDAVGGIYLNEGLIDSIFNWDNWHGYFLFKFGNSFYQKKGVFEIVSEKMPVSMRLGIISFFLTYLVCIPLGIFKAVKSGSSFDTFSSAVVLLGYAIPGFVLAVIMLVYLGPGESSLFHLIPLSGIDSSFDPTYSEWTFWQKLKDWAWHLIGPIICLSISSFANLTILTKNSILEELKQLYATTARAKGCSEKTVILKHVFKNATIPLITGFPGAFLSMFFAGALLIETIFNLDGMGLLGFNSVIRRDYPLMLGTLYFFTILGMLGHLLRDIGYALVDPRISYE